MIKLSRLADYAVVLLTQMGDDPKHVFNALDLSARTALPMPTVSKILATPDQISVADIIAAIDGPIALTQCVDDSTEDCTVQTLCPTRAGWHKINDAIHHALDQVSLAELTTPAPMLQEKSVSGGKQ